MQNAHSNLCFSRETCKSSDSNSKTTTEISKTNERCCYFVRSYVTQRAAGKDERFWGQLDFDTTSTDPTVTFRAINHKGKELKAFTLTLGELNHEAAKAEQKPPVVKP